MRIGVEAGFLLRSRYTGIEVYLSELVTRMPRIGHRHEFRLCFNYNRPRHRMTVERLTGRGAEARNCRIPPPLLWSLHRYVGLPLEWVYGPLDVMFYPSPCEPRPQKRGRKVMTVHDLFPLTHPEWYPSEDVLHFQRVVLPSVLGADTVIVVSAYTGAVIQDRFGLPADRIHCVPNGVDERFRPPENPEAAAAVASRYGINEPYFLFLGTREPRKNVVRLIDAFGRAAARDHTLVVAGQAFQEEGAIRSAVSRLDPAARVMFPGYIAWDDLPALYGAAAGFLFPSLAEGFGIPVLEAMACGCPVLTSATSALGEVAGDAAFTVNPYDVEDIAEGIRCLATQNDTRDTLRERGFRRAKEFSWDRTARETLAVMEAV